MSMGEIVEREARLVILRCLAEQPDFRLNSSLLQQELRDKWAIAKSRDWVHEQLRFLADIGAIRTSDAGSVKIAEILRKGLDHAERTIVLDGVKKPSPTEA